MAEIELNKKEAAALADAAIQINQILKKLIYSINDVEKYTLSTLHLMAINIGALLVSTTKNCEPYQLDNLLEEFNEMILKEYDRLKISDSH